VRFTGQVRVPEVDHPGIPAMIVVENGLAEVLLDGESLGRWSLYDVHASRLVSSAFSISLDGEEITFIADEPVDFAYKGVEHMAGVWARYKAMTIPRRMVAVGRSRRGTTPSRIPELREAMLLNLQTAGRSPSYYSTAPAPTTSEPEPSPWAKRLDAYSNVPAPIDDVVVDGEVLDERDEVGESVAVVPEPEAEPALPSAEMPEPEAEPAGDLTADEPEPVAEPTLAPADVPVADVPAADVASDQPAALRPGPGIIPRLVVRPPTDSTSTEPPDWDAAWEEPPLDEEHHYEELPPDAAMVFFDEEPVVEQAPVAEEPWPAVATDEETGLRELLLDLGHLEVDQTGTLAAPSPDDGEGQGEMLEPDLELLFAGAPTPEGERSGLFGAVRSAFARNRGGGPHEHQFVEAPGGIGIVRQICADCGYISIGVSD
jgi:hypothetical protein